jgi:hypothetical protein
MPGRDALEHLTELLMLGEVAVEWCAFDQLLVSANPDNLAVLENDDQVTVDHSRESVGNNK